MNRAERTARANQAQRILNDPLVADVFAAMESVYVNEWKNSAPSAADQRAWTYWRMQALKEFRREFEAMIADGDVIRAEARQTDPI